MTMPIEKGTKNQILRTVSKPVGQITADLRNFALDMIKAMEAENGVGIAAPQVGRNIRMVICKLNVGEKNEAIVPMVNPVLMYQSEETNDGEEGCLSLPGVWGKVTRSNKVILRFTNLKGKEQTLELDAFNARVVQHEMDHINGVLFIDRAEDVKADSKEAAVYI